MSFYARVGKRLFDLAAAGAASLLLSPVLLAVAAAIRLEDGGSPFYISERIGRGGEPFRFYKFRSMPENTASVPSAQAATLTVTRTGRLIRRTNIDELPQLVNILKGDMSIVGPRPGIPSQTLLISYRQANGALECRPGLTGLAQINSYDGMSAEAKARFDGEYARDISFLGDLKIILRTFGYLTKPPPTY
jgi:O-antigen biosynthesis protein WbqP